MQTARLIRTGELKGCRSFVSAPAAAVDSADAPLYLPYKALVSTISSMMFTEGEAHRLIEILSEKVGVIQDTWHRVRPARWGRKTAARSLALIRLFFYCLFFRPVRKEIRWPC